MLRRLNFKGCLPQASGCLTVSRPPWFRAEPAHGISAAPLGLVHRFVPGLEEVPGLLAVLRVGHDPDADGNGQELLSGGHEGLAEDGADLLRHLLGHPERVHTRQQHDEFITTDAGHRIRAAEHPQQAF